jgi:hypothetical protein
MTLPISRHFDCMKRCKHAAVSSFGRECAGACQALRAHCERQRDRRTFAGRAWQRAATGASFLGKAEPRTQGERRRSGPVRLTLEVNPAHLAALESFLIGADMATHEQIRALSPAAARGKLAATRAVDEMRTVQRYIRELTGAIQVAREFHFSTHGGNDAKETKNGNG